MEDGALLFQPVPQLHGVCQIAVMGKGHAALMVVDDQGLDVALVIRAGGGITHMAYHDIALAQGSQMLRCEYLVHKARIPEGCEYAVIIDDDTGALLSPVLEGEKAVVSKGGQIRGMV